MNAVGMTKKAALAVAVSAALGACGVKDKVSAPTLFPSTPPMNWAEQEGSDEWTRAALEALSADGIALMSAMPADVLEYCPAYARQNQKDRAAFWAGFVSALARQESGLNPLARARDGVRMGLMQITPDAAKSNGCKGSLLDAKANVTCAVRILAREVARDGAIHGGQAEAAKSPSRTGRWLGVAREFVTLRSDSQRNAVANFTKQQSYCR